VKQISVKEAAEIKQTTRQTINTAIRTGKIDATRIGSYNAVLVNKKFNDWQPDPVRQQIGRDSQKT